MAAFAAGVRRGVETDLSALAAARRREMKEAADWAAPRELALGSAELVPASLPAHKTEPRKKRSN